MKTELIACRVTEDLKNSIEAICKANKITLTDYCITKLTPSKEIPPIAESLLKQLEDAGINNKNNPFEIPFKLSYALRATGGLLVGIIVYKNLKENLKDNPEWNEDKFIDLAILTGIISAGWQHK